MEFETICAIIFMALMAITLIITRKRLILQKIIHPILYVVLYKTKFGLKAMDKVAKKFPKSLKYISYAGVGIGYLGMILITIILFQNLYRVLAIPGSVSGVGIIQPFAKNVPGTFFVPFFYFIISIFILVIIHEFSHGVMARRWGIKIKSSGLAVFGVLLPILPAAFVEPDEKQMEKKKRIQQLSILAAGPFSNILTAILVIVLLIFVVSPLTVNIIEEDGVKISGFSGENMPAETAGMKINGIITAMDGNEMKTVSNFTDYLDKKKPGDSIIVTVNNTEYNVTLTNNPANNEKAYLGVYAEQNTKINRNFEQKHGKFLAKAIIWIIGLLIWLYLLNLGIGLFNLMPLPITDGGKMMFLTLEKFMKKEKAMKIWKIISLIFSLLIILNLILSIIK